MIQKRLLNITLIFISTMLLAGCFEIKTNDAVEAYKYWAGNEPTKDVGLINGQYWQSPHWTKEYIMYLKIKPTKQWLDSYIKQSHLVIDNRNWTKPDDSPAWFNPPANSLRYSDGKDFDQGTRYICDPKSGFCYIYEIQL